MAKAKKAVPITTDEDRQLLYSYVMELYDYETAKEIIAKYENNLFGKNGLAFIIGRMSLPFFCQYFLQDTFRPKPDNAARALAPFHFEMWDALEGLFIEDKYDKLELVVPRGSSKTTTCDFALTVWAHCYNQSLYTLVCGKTEQDATEFVRNIKHCFLENEYIISVFGRLIIEHNSNYTVNNLELELTNGTKIQAIGSATSMRGKKYGNHRPTLIIADDYQGKADIESQEARDKKYTLWVQDCGMAGDKAVYRDGKKIKMATKFVVLGTLLHHDCFMSRLLKDSTYKHFVRRAINIDNIDEYFSSGLWGEFKRILFDPKDPHAEENAKEFYYQHQQEMQYPVLWPDKYDCLDLALNDYYPNPLSFKIEMQNDIRQEGTKAFHTIKTASFVDIEKNDYKITILCCDPAVETGKTNDYTALAVVGKTANNFRWVRRGIIAKLSFDQYIENVISLLEVYQDITHVWVEKNTFNGADVREIRQRISEHDTLKHRKIEIINERQNKNKESKIRAIGGKVDNGVIIFNEEDTDFNEQVLSYSGEVTSAHDDAPDIIAEADRLVDVLAVSLPLLRVLPLSYLGL